MGQLNTIPLEISINFSTYFSENDLFSISLLNKFSNKCYFNNNNIWKKKLNYRYNWQHHLRREYIGYDVSYQKCYKDDYCFSNPKKLIHMPHSLFQGAMCSSISIQHQNEKNPSIFAGGHNGEVYKLSKRSDKDTNMCDMDITKIKFIEGKNTYNTDCWIRALENIDNKVLAIGKGSELIIYPITSIMNTTDDANNNSKKQQHEEEADEQPSSISRMNYNTKEKCYLAHDGAIHDIKKYGTNCCATTSFDCTTKLWDVKQEKCIATLLGHEKQIYGITTCYQKHLIITSSYDHCVHVYDIRTSGRIPIYIYDHGKPAWFTKPTTLDDINNLNSFLSSCSDGKIREYDIRSNKADPVAIYTNMYNDCPCNSFDISYNNSNLICGYDDGRFSIFNMKNQELLFTKQTNSRYIRKVSTLSMLPTNTKFIYGTNDGTIGIINDRCNDDKFTAIELTQICSGIKTITAFSYNQQNVIIYGGTDGEVGFIEPML